MPASNRIHGAILIAAVILTVAPVRAGTDDKAEARRSFDAGVESARAGAYEQAIVAFRRAYQLSPNFAVLYNIGEAQRVLGDAAGALETLERYLSDGGAAVPPARRLKVESTIAAQRSKTALLTVRLTPPSARLLVDGTPIDPGAQERPIRLNPGRHKIEASDESHAPAEQEIAVTGGQRATIELTLPVIAATATAAAAAATRAPVVTPTPNPTTAPTPTPTPEVPARVAVPRLGPAPPGTPIVTAEPRTPGALQLRIGYGVAAAGLAGLGAGLISYLIARSSWQQAIDGGCTQLACDGAARAHYNEARQALTIADVSSIAGGAFLLGGAVLVLTAPPGPGPAPSIALGPAFPHGWTTLALSGRW